MVLFQVYWYHLAQHTNPHTQGYIGVTKENNVRRRCHINGVSGGSKILCKAFKKYGSENVIQDILHTVDSSEEAYELEMAYRPHPRTGWNIAIGGGLPPDCTGRVDSPETRKKRAEAVKQAKAGKTYLSVFKGMTDRHDEKRRKAIGDQHRGKTLSDAHKRAISEKMSGGDSPKAKTLFIVHKDSPEKVYSFPCIRVAADHLGIPYNTLRSQAQRTLKHDRTSEPSRTGWICLSPQDAENPVDAVNLTIAKRSARFTKMAKDREDNRRLKVLG